MRIGPILGAAAAERLEQSRRSFNDAAQYVLAHPAPEGTDPVAWRLHGRACEEMVAEMDAVLAEWEQRQ